MATKIIQTDLEATGLDSIELGRYDAALLVVRLNGSIIGQVRIPARGGKLDPSEARDAIHGCIDPRLSAQILADANALALGRAPAGFPASRATVAICTRERPEDLAVCLDGLTRLATPPREILVVDNAPSTPRTRDLTEGRTGIRYVVEPKKGLDNARNRAIAEARGEVIAFIDDDAVPEEMWLDRLLTPFGDEAVACVTGLTMPLELETRAQELFESITGFSRRGFVRRTFQSPAHNPLHTGPIGAGANFAVRRDFARQVGGFDPALDAGTATESGGDSDFFSRVLRAGKSIVYEPASVNWHRHRRTWKELRKVIYGYGVGSYAVMTRAYLVDGDRGAVRHLYGWFRYEQGPRLLRTVLGRPSPVPLALQIDELRGCIVGPFAYLKARRQTRAESPGPGLNGG